nr:6-phosphofructokinase [Klebsiella quasipneumoniae]
MKIGIVISGGDVSGMNNFIFQIARQADADITLFNGGIPGLLEKNHQDIAWRDLVDFSITAVPIITSGRTSRKLQPGRDRERFLSSTRKFDRLIRV